MENTVDFKIRIIFDRRKTASDVKKGAVEIEIYRRGERKRISTGVTLHARQWQNGLVVNHPDSMALNLRIQTKYRQVYEYFSSNPHRRLTNFSREDLDCPGFVDWLATQIEGRNDLSEQTLRQHRTMLDSVRSFGRLRAFADVTPENVMLWDMKLRTHLTKQTSVHDYHKRLKVYVNRAVKFGLLERSPYDLVKIPRGKEHNVKYLTEQERSVIESLELSGGLAVARDMFVMSCYTGLAYCDLVKVGREDIVTENGKEFICDRRNKTQGGYKLLVLPQVKEILRRYDYNMNRLSNQKCNVYLKAIAVMAGINRINLTFHVGRHTFATWALKKGVAIEVVSKMLAHADISTTQIYAKVLQSEVTAGFELLSYLSDDGEGF